MITLVYDVILGFITLSFFGGCCAYIKVSGGRPAKLRFDEHKNSERHLRPKFNPWVGKGPWRRKWQPTPVFLPGKSYG